MQAPAATLDPLERLLRPRSGRLFVVSGPSGVGKDAVLAALLDERHRPERLVRCVTATSRAPRPGEVDGRDYHFVSRREFEEAVAAGRFLEHAVYAGDYYGTPLSSVSQETLQGRDVLLKIDVQGGQQVRSRVPSAVLVFLAPPSWEELERRLRARRTDDQPEVRRRLAVARHEVEAAARYDYVVVNDLVEAAARKLAAIVQAERLRVPREPEAEP